MFASSVNFRVLDIGYCDNGGRGSLCLELVALSERKMIGDTRIVVNEEKKKRRKKKDECCEKIKGKGAYTEV